MFHYLFHLDTFGNTPVYLIFLKLTLSTNWLLQGQIKATVVLVSDRLQYGAIIWSGHVSQIDN